MFGMIARATLKEGKEQEVQSLLTIWNDTMWSQLPGKLLELVGNVAGQPNQVVFIALAQDEAAFQQMSASPEEHAFYGKFDAAFEEKPTIDIVQIAVTIPE
jgi:hypothetical protein